MQTPILQPVDSGVSEKAVPPDSVREPVFLVPVNAEKAEQLPYDIIGVQNGRYRFGRILKDLGPDFYFKSADSLDREIVAKNRIRFIIRRGYRPYFREAPSDPDLEVVSGSAVSNSGFRQITELTPHDKTLMERLTDDVVVLKNGIWKQGRILNELDQDMYFLEKGKTERSLYPNLEILFIVRKNTDPEPAVSAPVPRNSKSVPDFEFSISHNPIALALGVLSLQADFALPKMKHGSLGIFFKKGKYKIGPLTETGERIECGLPFRFYARKNETGFFGQYMPAFYHYKDVNDIDSVSTVVVHDNYIINYLEAGWRWRRGSFITEPLFGAQYVYKFKNTEANTDSFHNFGLAAGWMIGYVFMSKEKE